MVGEPGENGEEDFYDNEPDDDDLEFVRGLVGELAGEVAEEVLIIVVGNVEGGDARATNKEQ